MSAAMTGRDVARRTAHQILPHSCNDSPSLRDYVRMRECEVYPIMNTFIRQSEKYRYIQRDTIFGITKHIHCEAKKLHRFIFAIALSELHFL